MEGTLIIPLTCGAQSADLYLQFGVGTNNPSVLIVNHGTEAIEYGDITRDISEFDDQLVAWLAENYRLAFPDSGPASPHDMVLRLAQEVQRVHG